MFRSLPRNKKLRKALVPYLEIITMPEKGSRFATRYVRIGKSKKWKVDHLLV